MNRLQLWILLLAIWVVGLVAFEHSLLLTTIQFDVLIFVIIAIGAGLFLSELQPFIYSFLLVALVIAFSTIKLLLYGLPTPVPTLHFMATQAGAIVLTGAIAYQIGSRIRAFEEVISGISLSSVTPLPASFVNAQAVMYRELQRARHHERPLSIVMLQVDEGSMEAAIPRIAEEVQQAMMARYILSKVATILDEDLPKFDPVALRGNCFIAVLPEATATDAVEVAQQLSSSIEEQTGLKMLSGTATLLNEAMTFEELIECAEVKMQRTPRHTTGRISPDLELDQPSLLSKT